MHAQVDLQAVDQRLQQLKPPASGPPDPVSKLWARHLSQEVLARQAGSGGPTQGRSGSLAPGSHQLRGRFPDYFQQYGY